MSDRINPSVYFDSQLALSERRYLKFALYCIGNFFVYVLVAVVVVPIVGLALAVPIQGIIELLNWLQAAEWPHYTWSWLLGTEIVTQLTTTPNLGMNKVASWILNTWVSIPFSALGILLVRKLNSL